MNIHQAAIAGFGINVLGALIVQSVFLIALLPAGLFLLWFTKDMR